jgi:hypothetical protein
MEELRDTSEELASDESLFEEGLPALTAPRELDDKAPVKTREVVQRDKSRVLSGFLKTIGFFILTAS